MGIEVEFELFGDFLVVLEVDVVLVVFEVG